MFLVRSHKNISTIFVSFSFSFPQFDEKSELVPSESEGKEQQLLVEESEKKEEEKDTAISEKHPTATDLQTVTTRETAQTHDSVIPEKESKEEDASTAMGIEPNTASEATTQDDPPHGEQAVVSAVQAIAAPPAAETGSRATTSPPCEVSSTTSSQGLEETAPLPPAPPADDDKKVHGTTAAPRLVEGVIADSNNEKVLFEEEEEDDEIDDVEPAVSAPEKGTSETTAVVTAASSQVFHPDPVDASGAPNSGENERVLDPPQIISSDPHSDPVPEVGHSASDAASPVQGGSLEAAALVNSDLISISVVDRTAVQAAEQATEEGGCEGGSAEQKELRKHHSTTLDEVEDVSVTMVERKKRRPSSSPDRTTEKRRREEEDAVMIDSRLMRVEADATAVTDHHYHPEPIVTISKVSAVKATAAPAASPGPTDASSRRTPVSSPSAVQQPNPLQPPAAGTSYSMFAQRMRGGGGSQHPPPRPGGLMMMGHHPPPRGFLMRGGFRGCGPRGASSLPSLQPRPPLGGPMSLPPAGGFPSAAAGPVAEQLNRVAGRLADYMKHSLEDLFSDLSSQVELQRQCLLFHTQLCGSGIRCLFDPRDPGWVKIRIRDPDPRLTTRIIFPRA